MAARGLLSMLLAGALLWTACSREKPTPAEKPTPSPSGTAPAPRERRESEGLPVLDPTKKPPAGYRRMAVGGVAPTSEGNAVVLVDAVDAVPRRGLVLFVGGTEALSITLRLEQRRYDRPLTHDLLDSVLRKLGGDVVSVRVDRLENDVYFGSLLIAKEGRLVALDARPSDAIALAIGNDVPVYVADSVLAKAGIDLDRLDFRKPTEAIDAPERTVARHSGEVAL